MKQEMFHIFFREFLMLIFRMICSLNKKYLQYLKHLNHKDKQFL